MLASLLVREILVSECCRCRSIRLPVHKGARLFTLLRESQTRNRILPCVRVVLAIWRSKAVDEHSPIEDRYLNVKVLWLHHYRNPSRSLESAPAHTHREVEYTTWGERAGKSTYGEGIHKAGTDSY